jgi:hypothetical protein
MDWSLLISGIALIFALVSPIISAWISGHYRLKERKMEISAENDRRRSEYYSQHRAEVIERYLSAAGKACEFGTFESREMFGAAAPEMYLYVPPEYWATLDAISSLLETEENDKAKQFLRDLSKFLSAKQIRSPQKDLVDR